jgi:hypothetical protein
MTYTDEQLIDPNPFSLRHADDNLALVESDHTPKLPRSFQAKWIDSNDEREDRPGQFLATRNHQVIRAWATLRHAKPVLLRASDRSDPIQALRLQVSDRRVSEYDHVTWNEWFELMDGANLTFIYQERTLSGGWSDLYRFVPASAIRRNNEEHPEAERGAD